MSIQYSRIVTFANTHSSKQNKIISLCVNKYSHLVKISDKFVVRCNIFLIKISFIIYLEETPYQLCVNHEHT